MLSFTVLRFVTNHTIHKLKLIAESLWNFRFGYKVIWVDTWSDCPDRIPDWISIWSKYRDTSPRFGSLVFNHVMIEHNDCRTSWYVHHEPIWPVAIEHDDDGYIFFSWLKWKVITIWATIGPRRIYLYISRLTILIYHNWTQMRSSRLGVGGTIKCDMLC